MSFLLRLKHWQIFLLTVGAYASVIVAPLMIMHLMWFNTEVVAVLALAGFVVRAFWQLAMVRYLSKKIPAELTIGIGLFLVTFYLHFSYVVLISLLSIISRFVHISDQVAAIYNSLTLVRLWSSIISLLLAIFFSYVISTLLNTVEKQKYDTSVGDVVLLLFFPIGIWWIQPRVNRIFSGEVVFDPNTPLDQNITQQS